MHSFFLKLPFTENLMRAFCWMLIHSLWQGILLAVAAAVVILCTKKSRPSVRYTILSVLFFLFMAMAGITFISEWQPQSGSALLPAVTETDQHINIMVASGDVASASYIDRLASYFNEHASLIVTIWFIVFSLRSIQLFANIGYIRRIKHYRTHEAPLYWKKRLAELSQRLHLTQYVGLLESECVKVPVVAGFLKPVILFPFSMISRLPAEQVEAVLLHELAHIRRKDYLVNLLQSFAEVIFFFNPGVLWLSSLIREERENCCDDIALGQTESKKEFIRALVAFEEYEVSGTPYAMAFPGQKNHLLNRVKRILTNNNKTLNNMQKILLATCIVIAGFVTATFSQTKPPAPAVNNTKPAEPPAAIAQTPAPPAVADTVPKLNKPEAAEKDAVIERDNAEPRHMIWIDDSGKKYDVVMSHGKIIKLFVDGNRIPDDKIHEYEPVIAKIEQERKAQEIELQKQEEAMAVQEKVLEEQRMRLMKQQMELQQQMEEMRMKQNQQFQKQELEMKLQKMKLDQQEQMLRIQMMKEHPEMAEVLEERNRDRITVTGEPNQRRARIAMDMQAAPDQVSMTETEHDPVRIEVDDPVTIPDLPAMAISRDVAVGEPVASIVADLKMENIINDVNNVSFTLNNKVLIVNKVKQSEALHKRLSEKYIQGNPGNHVIYSKNKNSSRTDVEINN